MVKEKIVAWLRRHKIKFIIIGIVCAVTIDVWSYFNAPININRMTSADWQNTHISKLGITTICKLESNTPYTNINDINKIDGIGKIKQKQIKHYFTTWDTAKADAWFSMNICAIILISLCAYEGAKTKHTSNENKKWLSNKLNKLK